MLRLTKILVFVIVVLLVTLTACAQAGPSEPQSTAENGNTQSSDSEADSNGASQGVTVVLIGAVNSEQSWSEEQLRSMDTIESRAANSQGEQDSYTGVPIKDLLATAQPQVGAASIIFSDAEGNSAEFPLEQILNCADCILSFRNRGGFSVVVPGNDPDLPIRGVVRIEVR